MGLGDGWCTTALETRMFAVENRALISRDGAFLGWCSTRRFEHFLRRWVIFQAQVLFAPVASVSAKAALIIHVVTEER